MKKSSKTQTGRVPPHLQHRRPTARDVASELGVSVKTVTNAYNRPDQLSRDLRTRILDAAARLGYGGPDPLAAGLRRGRVGAVGVIYANRLSYTFEDPVSHGLLAGIASAVEHAGSGLLLLPGSSDPDRRLAAMTRAIVDGLIVSSVADDDPFLAAAISRRLPLAVIDQPRPDHLERLGSLLPWVGVDDRTAAAGAAKHLLALGHRHLGVVAFGMWRSPRPGLVSVREQHRTTYAVSRDRLAGYRDSIERLGVPWDAVPVYQGSDSTPAEGETGAALILAQRPRPTALLCLSDRIAEGAVRAAGHLGLRVPSDLSIVGFDDAPSLASDLALTTVRQPHRRKGEVAAQALLTLLGSGDPQLVTTLETELVVRASTTHPPP